MSGTSLRRTALSGARWMLSARFATQLITWPATIVVMRLLDAADYGLFAIAMLITGFIALFAELGLGVALVQAPRLDTATARMACTLILALNAMVALLIVGIAPWVADLLEEPDAIPVMRLLTLELLISACAAVPQALLERALHFRALSIAPLAGAVVGAAATLTAALLDAGVWSLVIGNLAASTVRSALVLAYHRGPVWPGWPKLRLIRPMVRVSGHVLLGRGLWYWYGQSDQMVLARLLHTTLLGFYSVAAQLAMLPASKVMEAVNRVAFPILARMRDDAAGLAQAHDRLLGLLALYAFGVCWGLAAVAPDFVALVLGSKWSAAATPLVALALVAPLRMLCSLHNTITTSLGMPEAATKELAIASVLMPVAVSTGAWLDGLTGASLAWLAAFPLVWLLSNALTCAALGRSAGSGIRPLAAPAGAGLAMFAAVWFTARGLAGGPLALRLVIEIAVGAAVYAGLLWYGARSLVQEAGTFVRDLVRPRPAPDSGG